MIELVSDINIACAVDRHTRRIVKTRRAVRVINVPAVACQTGDGRESIGLARSCHQGGEPEATDKAGVKETAGRRSRRSHARGYSASGFFERTEAIVRMVLPATEWMSSSRSLSNWRNSFGSLIFEESGGVDKRSIASITLS